ncbi:hypothetical protein CPB83DRAFT_761509 [Crepidotus variabilis]|uniref:Uncharacterized protein n=1 Tax=Crepidotus variabilis TaxID=179855 RepID=A0A9P6ELN2_9AGAR|nr:hypothetical protein CPB83DRAFT_761509 [Crepidotus variabilis]
MPDGDEGKGGPIGKTYIFRVIPSRIGVAFISSLMFVCSISMAVGASLIANRLDGQLTPVQRLAIIFQVLNYLFVALASMVGLYSLISILHRNAISPLSRARKACQLFCGLLLGHLPFSIASGALSIHIVFKATTRALRVGIETAERKAGSPLYWICTKTQLIKGLIVVLYLALWFLEVVALYAGTRYSAQLHSVEMIKNVEDEEAADY